MAQAHNHRPAAVFRGAGRDHELGGERLLRHNQGMVASTGERRFEPGEDALAVVSNRAGFAVHQVAGADDLTAECFADGLVTQADAENRHFPGHVANERNQNSRIGRSAGAGREQDALRLQRLDLFHGQFVVAIDLNLRAQLSQVLDKVVGERVVVVENKNHDELQCSAPPSTGWRFAVRLKGFCAASTA